MNAIDINRWIYDRLRGDGTINGLVGEQVYPIIVEENGKFPFLVFTRRSAQFSYGKDGRYGDTATVAFTAVAKDYATTCKVVQRVRELFELCPEAEKAHVTALDEGYYSNCYVQTITMEFELYEAED